MSVLAYLWSLFIIYFVGFRLNTHGPYYILCEIIVDIIFAFDIYFIANTAYFDESSFSLVFEKDKIRSRYFKFWFWVDLIGSIPFPIIINSFHGSKYNILTAQRIFMVLKVSRLHKLFEFKSVSVTAGQFFAKYNRLKDITKIFILLVHFLGCGFHFIATTDDEYPHSEGIVVKGLTNTGNDLLLNIYENVTVNATDPNYPQTWVYQNQFNFYELSKLDRYIASIYWCLTTMLTIGYGDIHAVNNAERVFSIVTELIGVGVFGTIMSEITNVISKIDPKGREKKKAKEELKAYLAERPVPQAIKLMAQVSALDTLIVVHYFTEAVLVTTDIIILRFLNSFTASASNCELPALAVSLALN